jgi:hypothetical protein
MILGDSQDGSDVQDRESFAIAATSTKQAPRHGWQAHTLAIRGHYDRNAIQSFSIVSTRALYAISRAGYSIHEIEINLLRALESYCLADTSAGIVQVESFLKVWHASKRQSRVQGAIFGLAKRGYVQLFDQRKNGTRYIGITALGAKVLEVYYAKVAELIARIEFRRPQAEFTEKAIRFQKVAIEHVDNLYTRSMTTKNRHLYDASKYYNEDGSIKN